MTMMVSEPSAAELRRRRKPGRDRDGRRHAGSAESRILAVVVAIHFEGVVDRQPLDGPAESKRPFQREAICQVQTLPAENAQDVGLGMRSLSTAGSSSVMQRFLAALDKQMIKTARRRAISLRVSGICPAAAGPRAGSMAAAMVRKAAASMARVIHRYQEVQRRTWCSSSPARPLPAWKFSSIVQRSPATLTRAASGTWRGRSSGRRPVPGAAVAADQQPAVSGPAGVDGEPGPVVAAVALGAITCRVAAARHGWAAGRRSGADGGARPGGDMVIAATAST